MQFLLYLATITTGALALVGRAKTHTDAPFPTIQPHPTGWKSHYWHNDDSNKTGYHRSHSRTKVVTVTVTITTTVTEPGTPFTTTSALFPNGTTSSVDDSSPTKSDDDFPPITLITLSSVSSIAVTSSDDSLSSATSGEPQPMTLITLT